MAQQVDLLRQQRQAQIDVRVAKLRAQADRIEARANRALGTGNTDLAYGTQPAFANAAGRSLLRHREQDRNAYLQAGSLVDKANELRMQADALERRGAVVAGDATQARKAKIEACEVVVGQLVQTTFYGLRKVLKVNSQTVLVEGGFEPLKVEKQYIRAA